MPSSLDSTNNAFTQAVVQYLLDKHEYRYTGEFILRVPDGEEVFAYSLQWLENNRDRPYVVMGDFNTDDDFLTYVKKDIDSGRFFLKQVFILKRTDREGRT